MKSNIGRDSQALVRDAIKAWRASSGGAAGPVPAVAAMMRLLFGQMTPHTLSSITMPYAPPNPIEYTLLGVVKLPTVNFEVKKRRIPYDTKATRIIITIAKIRPSLVRAGTFLIIRYSTMNKTTGYVSQANNASQTLTLPPPSVLEFLTAGARMYIA